MLPAFLFAQNNYSVCNVPGVKADFKTLQGAVDSVAAGSILYVFPSTSSYGAVVINKKLAIFGTGFLLDQNSQPASSPNTSGVILDVLNLVNGSSNSYIDGLQLINMTGGSFPVRLFLDSVSNVTITRCAAYTQLFGPHIISTRNCFNCTISNCYFVPANPADFGHSGGNYYKEIGTGSFNLQFNNNLFDDRMTVRPFVLNYLVSSYNFGTVFFNNNTIIADLGGSSFSNYTYVNNFFIHSGNSSIQPVNIQLNSLCLNNITNSPNLFALAKGVNNIQNANADSIFMYSTFGYHPWEEKWKVRDTSFAKTFSSTGGEVGAFGGNTPYKLSGLSTLPFIYDLSVTKDSAIRGNVKVRIKARANY